MRFFIKKILFLWCFLLSLETFIGCLSLSQVLSTKQLSVGEELEKQVLSLRMGKALYELRGLKQSLWYEVKISYPSSIPASFSLQVKNNVTDLWFNKSRRLLNTEKVIFRNAGQSEMYVLVIVESAGIVAKPGVQESEFVLFNIVCDELSFGIPYKAWWVGIAAIACLMLASVAPYFLPLHQLLKIGTSQSSFSVETKSS